MFDELTGNSRVKEALKRMLATDRLPGAMLFAGEEGIGKKRFALEVARVLNCRTPKDHEACGVCSSCAHAKLNYPQRDDADEWTQIIWTDHPDVGLVVAPKRVLRVEQMRQIERKPTSALRRQSARVSDRRG
jgi:DNA polymerase-3 subunit delta'